MTPVNSPGSPEESAGHRSQSASDVRVSTKSADGRTVLNQPESVLSVESPPAFFFIFAAVGVLLIWMGYSITQRPAKNQFSSTFAAHATQCTINPNTASWASLVRIPDIGPARAEKLLAWRKAHQPVRAQIVFHSLADLRRVPSFGPKTIAQIARYLRFPRIRVVSAQPPSPRLPVRYPVARPGGIPQRAHGRRPQTPGIPH
jgi:DNA uptake protein ComE-like DNA-binding protein